MRAEERQPSTLDKIRDERPRSVLPGAVGRPPLDSQTRQVGSVEGNEARLINLETVMTNDFVEAAG